MNGFSTRITTETRARGAANPSGRVVLAAGAEEIPPNPTAISADAKIDSKRLGEMVEAVVLPIQSAER